MFGVWYRDGNNTLLYDSIYDTYEKAEDRCLEIKKLYKLNAVIKKYLKDV